jgi:hypothetical protein
MRKILLVLAVCLSAALPGAALADIVFVGGGPVYQEIQAEFDGRQLPLSR